MLTIVRTYFCLYKVTRNLTVYLVEDPKKELENVGEGMRENKTISWIAVHKLGKNNTKGVECSETFSSCAILQVFLLRLDVFKEQN